MGTLAPSSLNLPHVFTGAAVYTDDRQDHGATQPDSDRDSATPSSQLDLPRCRRHAV